MPSTSPHQHAFMEAISHDPAFARRVGVPAGVGQEFVAADRHYADGGTVDDPLPDDDFAWLERALARRPRNRGYADGGSVLSQLPPELLAQLAGVGPNQTLDYGGMTYMPVGVGGGGGEDLTSFTPQGYAAFTQGTALKPGAKGVEYAPDGNGYAGYQIQDGGAPDKQMLMAALVFAGGVGALGGFGGAALGGADGAIDPSLAVQGNSINALDAATGVPYGSEAAGAGGFTGSGLNPAFDTVGDITNINPLTTSGVGNGATLPMTPGGWEAATLPAAGSVPATSMGFDASLGLGLNGGVTSPGASGPSATTPASIGNSLSGMSPTDIAKLITSAVSAANGSSSQGSPAPQGYVSHEIDPGYSMLPPGWRSDRPLYVPGQDAIPDGWFGAGHTG